MKLWFMYFTDVMSVWLVAMLILTLALAANAWTPFWAGVSLFMSIACTSFAWAVTRRDTRE